MEKIDKKSVGMIEKMKIEKIKTQLSELSCPLIELNDDTFIKEILLKPNDHRMKILNWLFESIVGDKPNLDDTRSTADASCLNVSRRNDGRKRNLDNTLSIVDASCLNVSRRNDGGRKKKLSLQTIKVEENVSEKRELLKWASSVGLCERTDSDIIEGTASLERQLRFFVLLLDLAVINKQMKERCQSDDSFDLNSFRGPIFEIGTKLRAAKCSFPPDIRKEIDLMKANGGVKKVPVSDLRTQLEKLEEQVEDLNQELELKKQVSLPSYDPADIDPTTKLVNKLNELVKISERFRHLYGAHSVDQSINKIDATGVGYESKEVVEKQEEAAERFEDLEKIKNSLDYLITEANPEIQKLTKN